MNRNEGMVYEELNQSRNPEIQPKSEVHIVVENDVQSISDITAQAMIHTSGMPDIEEAKQINTEVRQQTGGDKMASTLVVDQPDMESPSKTTNELAKSQKQMK